MENPILDAYSILHNWAENTATGLDDDLYHADDGHKWPVKEVQAEFDRTVSRMISELEQLRTKCKVQSWKQFKAENL